MTLDKIMTGVMGEKTVNIPVQIRQSSERGLRVPQSGQMGNKCMPEGFRHSEQQPQGLLWLGDGSKSLADGKQKPILTSFGFTIQTSRVDTHGSTRHFYFGVCDFLESFIKLQIVCFKCNLEQNL